MTRSTGRRFVVVRTHPLRDSLVHAAADRCVESLRRSGHEVTDFDLYADEFDPVVSLDEWRNRRSGLPAELQKYGDALQSATDLVLVYPTWFGSQPAMLKGWLDRVWVEGVAYDLDPGARVAKGRLQNIKSLWLVTTHGSSKVMNAVQGEAGKHYAARSFRLLCSWRARVHWVAFYGNDRATAVDRAAFLQRVSAIFARL